MRLVIRSRTRRAGRMPGYFGLLARIVLALLAVEVNATAGQITDAQSVGAADGAIVGRVVDADADTPISGRSSSSSPVHP
jgi:H+/Cl- antiporter ClcA